MDRKIVEGLLFYYANAANIDDGGANQTIEVLKEVLDRIDKEEKSKKRRSPNKSGVCQLDKDTNQIIAEYQTQKEALIAIGREGKSGIGDALNGRTKTHIAYGYKWYFKNELPIE